MLLALPSRRNHPWLKKFGRAAIWLAILALALAGMSSLSIHGPTPPLPVKYRPQLGAISQLGINATSLSFYNADDTVNRLRFFQSQMKEVVGDLRIVIAVDHPLTNFTLNCIFYRPDGNVSVAFPVEVIPGKQFWDIAFSYQQRFWEAGVYHVEIYYQDSRIAAGSFEIVEDCFLVGSYPVCNPLH